MPQLQTIGKKNSVHHPAPGSKLKLGGKSAGRPAGGHSTNRAGEKSLVQCIERKLQPPKSQPTTAGLYHRKCGLPVGRIYSPAINRLPVVNNSKPTLSSGTLTCPPTFRLPKTSSSRKSLSLIDLSPGGIDLGDHRSESGASSARMGDSVERTMDHAEGVMTAIHSSAGRNTEWPNHGPVSADLETQPSSEDVNKAASVVCHLLAINAWRRRREEVVALQQNAEELGQQVNHLHIQIVVLRRLLHTENCRVEKLGAEVHQVKIKLDDVTRERDAYKTEKEKLDEKLQQSKADSVERTTVTENLRNELMTAKGQVEALDTQITKEREKLLKLREDKKMLLNKVSATEALAGEREIRADRAEAEMQELEARLIAQEGVIETLQEDNRRSSRDLKATESEKQRLEKRLRLSEDAGRALSLRAANLEMQLSDRESALRRIESAYNSQLNELTDLREQMQRQSQEGGWSSRVLQIAGSVVWAPRAILRSLSFLSTSGAQ